MKFFTANKVMEMMGTDLKPHRQAFNNDKVFHDLLEHVFFYCQLLANPERIDGKVDFDKKDYFFKCAGIEIKDKAHDPV